MSDAQTYGTVSNFQVVQCGPWFPPDPPERTIYVRMHKERYGYRAECLSLRFIMAIGGTEERALANCKNDVLNVVSTYAQAGTPVPWVSPAAFDMHEPYTRTMMFTIPR